MTVLALSFGANSYCAAENVVDIKNARRSCGRHSLYVLLKTIGVDAKYEDVAKLVPVTEQGTSLSDLLCGSKKAGCNLLALKASPDDLTNNSFPLIAHVWLNGQVGDDGHYIVLLASRNDTFICADATRSELRTISVKEFSTISSGYFLIVDDQIGRWANRLWNVVICQAVVLCGLVLWQEFRGSH